MKKVQKYLNYLLVLVLLCLVSINMINVLATENKFTLYGSSYEVAEVLDSYDLGYGVYFQREKGLTSVNESGLSSGVTLNQDAEQQVHLLTIKPNENVEVVPYTYLEGDQWSAMAVKKAAAKYETTHPGYKVIAGVNGDFFQINESVRASTGVTISQGEYYKAISHHNASEVNTLAIKNSGQGKQLFNTKVNDSYPVLTIYDGNNNIIKKVDINKVNEEPGSNEISLYYAQRETNFGKTLIPISVNNAWVVSKSDTAVTSCKDSFYGVGKISDFTTVDFVVESNQFALKCNNQEISEMLASGVKIRAQYEYKDSSLEGVENFIGFPYQLLSEGKYVCQDQVNNGNWINRHPRTMIGQKDNGEIVLAVVDGRQGNKGMNGVTGAEMSVILASKGCVDAWNFDGGGSSTMIVRKVNGFDFTNDGNSFNRDNSNWYVTNSPSDGSERSDGNHLFVVVKLPEVTLEMESATETSITLSVVLITEIEKYKDLYVLINDNYYPVVNERVVITDLLKDTDYDIYLYTKVDGEYYYLMNHKNYCTSKEKPTEISLNVSLFDNKGVEQILFTYVIDKSEAIKKIVFIDSNSKRYLTTTNTSRINKDLSFYNLINSGKVEVYYETNKHFEEEILIIENISISYDIKFLMDEALFTTSNLINNIFE